MSGPRRARAVRDIEELIRRFEGSEETLELTNRERSFSSQEEWVSDESAEPLTGYYLRASVRLAIAIAGNTTTKVLKLNYYPSGVCVAVMEALRHNTALEEIVFDACEDSCDFANALHEALAENTHLRVLSLSGDLSDQTGEALAWGLARNTGLKSLQLSNYSFSFSDLTGHALGEALNENCSLEHLSLESSDYLATFVANALKQNRTLKSFRVWDNNYFAPAGFLIAQMLESNKSLETLYFCSRFQDAGVAIAEALARNQTLKSLTWLVEPSGHEVTEESLRHVGQTLQTAFRSNSTLQHFECNLSAAALVPVMQGSGFEALRSLGWFGNINGDDPETIASSVSNLLHRSDSLQRLALNVSDDGVALIAGSLQHRGNLHSVQFNTISMGAHSCLQIAELLRTSSLQHLVLNGLGGTTEAHLALFRALKFHGTLRSLAIRFSNQDDEDSSNVGFSQGEVLADALMHNQALKSLSLDGWTQESFILPVLEALKHDRTLQELKLAQVPPGTSPDFIGDRIVDLFQSNCTLTSVDVKGLGLRAARLHTVAQATRRNREAAWQWKQLAPLCRTHEGALESFASLRFQQAMFAHFLPPECGLALAARGRQEDPGESEPGVSAEARWLKLTRLTFRDAVAPRSGLHSPGRPHSPPITSRSAPF